MGAFDGLFRITQSIRGTARSGSRARTMRKTPRVTYTA